ncbi:MAG TPA: HIT family protein [Gemmataceae bacterium]|jgi:diadenosine tetraphosphate (Ap4A) HIT family hydrolase|nr:HIT family protein [Gemmataceae bacterium]
MSDSVQCDCPFCGLPSERILGSNAHAVAVEDAFPVSPGYTLIILRRHTASFFELTSEELAAVYDLVLRAKNRLAATLRPAGYNIGVNEGGTAGQTIMHLHVHLIPRFVGDVTDPRGGVRSVIPGKGPYG